MTFFRELLSTSENLTFTLSSLNCQRLICYDSMRDEYRILAPRIYINSFKSKASGRNPLFFIIAHFFLLLHFLLSFSFEVFPLSFTHFIPFLHFSPFSSIFLVLGFSSSCFSSILLFHLVSFSSSSCLLLFLLFLPYSFSSCSINFPSSSFLHSSFQSPPFPSLPLPPSSSPLLSPHSASFSSISRPAKLYVQDPKWLKISK